MKGTHQKILVALTALVIVWALSFLFYLEALDKGREQWIDFQTETVHISYWETYTDWIIGVRSYEIMSLEDAGYDRLPLGDPEKDSGQLPIVEKPL